MRYTVSSVTLGSQCDVLCVAASKVLSLVLNADFVLYAGNCV